MPILPAIRKSFEKYWDHKVLSYQFLLLNTQLVYPHDQSSSILRFQLSYYPQRVLEGIILLPTDVSFHKEVLSSGKFSTTPSVSVVFTLVYLYPSVELLSVITISLSMGLLWIIFTPLLEIISECVYISINVTIYSFWFTLRIIFKIKRPVFIILKSPRAGNNLINRSLCGI